MPLGILQVGEGELAVTDDAVWLGGIRQIERVNVATNQIVATYKVSFPEYTKVSVGFGSVWVAFEARRPRPTSGHLALS